MVLPALNEEGTVALVVKEVHAAIPDCTILVVDDGSVDHTGEQALEAGAQVVTNPFTLGVGGAMRVGFRVAKAHDFDILLQVDADGQHDARDISLLLAELDDEPGPQVVIGARFAGTEDFAVPRARRLAMRILAHHLSRVTKTHLTDVTSGFRAHNRAAIELFAVSYPADYLSDTIESLVIVADAGGRIHQVPVTMRPRLGRFAQPTAVEGRPLPGARRGLPGPFGVPAALLFDQTTNDGGIVTGVHIIALASALITLSVIIELSRRRHLHEKYAVTWLAVAVVIAVFAVFPGLFNSIAHHVGVKNPPDLLAVIAVLFLLTVCVRLSWEIGRLEDHTRTLAEEVAILRKDLDDRTLERTETVTTRPASDRHWRRAQRRERPRRCCGSGCCRRRAGRTRRHRGRGRATGRPGRDGVAGSPPPRSRARTRA